jgi:hypothetical protein
MDTPADAATEPSGTVIPFDKVREELGSLTSDADPDTIQDTLRKGVEAVGGYVLFDLTIGEDAEARWTAAIAFEGDDGRRLAILAIEPASGEMSLEPAEESDLPIAAIASSYAGLAEQWGRAAA